MTDSDPMWNDQPPRGTTPPPMARPVLTQPETPPPLPFGHVGSPLQAVIELSVLFAVFIAAQIVGVLILYSLGVRDRRWVNVLGTFVIGAVLLVAVLVIARRGPRRLATIGYRSDFLVLDVALGIGLTFLVLTLFAITALLLAIYAPHIYSALEKTPQAIRAAFPPMHPTWFILMSAWVAVFEETLFRGFLLTRLHAIVPAWPVAILVGAGIFAMPHFYEGTFAMGLIFLLGVLMGTVFVWRRSLVPVIVLHFLFNSVELMVLYQMSPDWK